jgi:hypothetical protein
MNSEYIKEVGEWVTWYNWHRSQMEHASLEKKVEFLAKANYGAIKLIAGLVDEIVAKEQGGSSLLVPLGVKW